MTFKPPPRAPTKYRLTLNVVMDDSCCLQKPQSACGNAVTRNTSACRTHQGRFNYIGKETARKFRDSEGNSTFCTNGLGFFFLNKYRKARLWICLLSSNWHFKIGVIKGWAIYQSLLFISLSYLLQSNYLVKLLTQWFLIQQTVPVWFAIITMLSTKHTI